MKGNPRKCTSRDDHWEQFNDGQHKKDKFITFLTVYRQENTTWKSHALEDYLEKVDVFGFLGLYAKINKSSFQVQGSCHLRKKLHDN